jgi:hypothetical protein
MACDYGKDEQTPCDRVALEGLQNDLYVAIPLGVELGGLILVPNLYLQVFTKGMLGRSFEKMNHAPQLS